MHGPVVAQGASQRISTTRIGRIPACRQLAVVRAPVRSPPRCRRSPMRSVTRRAAAIYLFARDHGAATGVTAATVAERVRRPPERRPPPPRQARRRRLPRGRPVERRRGCRCRSPVEALRRGRRRAPHDDADFPVRSDDLVLSLLGRALAIVCRATQAEAMAEEVGQEYGRAMAAGLTGDATRTPASVRCARRCRPSPMRSPRTGSPPTPTAQQPAADHQQPLPVRRRRHRAPGHLRRRPRDGQGHARRARRRTATTRRRHHRVELRPAATRSAPPPSDATPGSDASQRCGDGSIIVAVLGVLDHGDDGVARLRGAPRRTAAAGRTRSSADTASAAVRSTSSSTRRNAMSIPLDTPAAVMIRRSRCSTTRSAGRGRAVLVQLVP